MSGNCTASAKSGMIRHRVLANVQQIAQPRGVSSDKIPGTNDWLRKVPWPLILWDFWRVGPANRGFGRSNMSAMAGRVHLRYRNSNVRQGIRMRFSIFLAILVAGLSVASPAQTSHRTPKTKPSHDQARKSKAAVAPMPKETKPGQNSAAQQLRRTEAEGAKVNSRRALGAKSPKGSVAKLPREKPAPPIRVASAKGGDALSNRGTNPYKGRLRQKGANHHR